MIYFFPGRQYGFQDCMAGRAPEWGASHLRPRTDATRQAAESWRCHQELPDFAPAPQAPAIAVEPYRISGQIDEQTASV